MTNETTAGVEQRKITDAVALALIESLEATGDDEAVERYWRLRNQLSERGFTITRAEQPRPTEIRDPILRLFIEEILRQTPNGEAIRVKYHPNGEWSVLPEAGKADAGLVEALEIWVAETAEHREQLSAQQLGWGDYHDMVKEP